MKTENNSQPAEAMPRYKSPTITTFTAEELLDMVGPVQAGGCNMDERDHILGSSSGYIAKIMKVV